MERLSLFGKGDVNLDGVVSIADATMLQKYLVDRVEFNQIQECNALVGDYYNTITIDNATLIQKYLVGSGSLDGSGKG